jgi:hypothetical protein
VTVAFCPDGGGLPDRDRLHSLVLNGPLMAGFHIACIRKLMSGRTEVGDCSRHSPLWRHAAGLSRDFGLHFWRHALLDSRPGRYAMPIYLFVHREQKMDFWPAMQTSHELVKKIIGFTLSLTLILINLGGFSLFVGLLITMPLSYAAITVAYRDLVGFDRRTLSQ